MLFQAVPRRLPAARSATGEIGDGATEDERLDRRDRNHRSTRLPLAARDPDLGPPHFALTDPTAHLSGAAGGRPVRPRHKILSGRTTNTDACCGGDRDKNTSTSKNEL